MDAAITKVRCFPVFMVPDEEYPNAVIIDFKQLNEELKAEGTVLNRIGIVGTTTIPHQVYLDVSAGFPSVELVDITDEYETMRAYKSDWEVEQISRSVEICDLAYDKMMEQIRPDVYEYEVAAAGEATCRQTVPTALPTLPLSVGRTRKGSCPDSHQQEDGIR